MSREGSHKNKENKQGELTYAEVNDTVLRMLEPPGPGWYVLFSSCVLLLAIGAGCWV